MTKAAIWISQLVMAALVSMLISYPHQIAFAIDPADPFTPYYDYNYSTLPNISGRYNFNSTYFPPGDILYGLNSNSRAPTLVGQSINIAEINGRPVRVYSDLLLPEEYLPSQVFGASVNRRMLSYDATIYFSLHGMNPDYVPSKFTGITLEELADIVRNPSLLDRTVFVGPDGQPIPRSTLADTWGKKFPELNHHTNMPPREKCMLSIFDPRRRTMSPRATQLSGMASKAGTLLSVAGTVANINNTATTGADVYMGITERGESSLTGSATADAAITGFWTFFSPVVGDMRGFYNAKLQALALEALEEKERNLPGPGYRPSPPPTP